MNIALQCMNSILWNTSFRMEVYPNWPLFHGSLIKNRSVYEQWGGSEAQARKDIGKGLGEWASQKYLQNKPCIRLCHISHNTFCLRVSCPPTLANSSACALSYLLFGISIVPREMETIRMQNCLRALGGKKHANKVEIWKWRIVQVLTRTPTHTPIPHTIMALGKHASNQWLWT